MANCDLAPGKGNTLSDEVKKDEATKEKDENLARILGIPLTVQVEVGNTRLPIEELLNLGPGSVIELNKMAGEPVDFFANGKLIGRGEVVVVNEKFGIRLHEIVSQEDRAKSLG